MYVYTFESYNIENYKFYDIVNMSDIYGNAEVFLEKVNAEVKEILEEMLEDDNEEIDNEEIDISTTNQNNYYKWVYPITMEMLDAIKNGDILTVIETKDMYSSFRKFITKRKVIE